MIKNDVSFEPLKANNVLRDEIIHTQTIFAAEIPS